MKPILSGAVLALVWLLVGAPTVNLTVGLLPALVQPVTVAFAAGLAARPYVRRPTRRVR